MLCHFLPMNTSIEYENFILLFFDIRSFQGLLYHFELNANGFYLLLYIKISRDVYQKVCFGNNTYSGILTDFYHSFFLGVVPTMNNMQSKRQCHK